MRANNQQKLPLDIRIRRSDERGHADYGWLNSYHTFSFAEYEDPEFEGFGPLRVINEDVIEGSEGFDLHPHANFEIFTYVLSGAVLHRDSMRNVEIVERGGVQFTSAGSGILHSEHNADRNNPVHILQMWVEPHTRNLKPNYQTRRWTDEEKFNQLRLILSPTGANETIKINQNTNVFASILENGATVTHNLNTDRIGYLHLAQTSVDSKVKINDVILSSGDGAFIRGTGQLNITGLSDSRAEFILFDLPQ